jgi:hypothetical protein
MAVQQSQTVEQPWRPLPEGEVDWLPLLPPAARQVLDCSGVEDDLAARFAMVQPRSRWQRCDELRRAGDAIARADVVLYRHRLAQQDPAIVLGHHVPQLRPTATIMASFPASFDQPTLQRMLKRAHLTWARIDRVSGDARHGWIVRAGRSPEAPQPLLIQTMIMAPEACQYVRVLEPDRASATIPGVRTVSALRTAKLSAALAGETRVFIFQRAIQDPLRDEASFDKLAKAGFLIVAEYDDLPSRWPGNVKADYFCLRAAHAVQTSTQTLAEWIGQHNPYVEVFENQLAYLPPPRTDLDDPLQPVRVFFGALNRQEDWAPLREPINAALRLAGGRAHVEVIHDRAFFDALDTPHKTFTPLCDYQQYHAVLRRCHVALLPLSDTPFNRCKSDLKFLEAAGHSVAALASPTVYEGSIEPGRTGILCRTAGEFGSSLQRLIDDAPLRQSLGKAARQWVAQHRLLADHYTKRAAWYRQLAARRDELEAARRRRL